MSTNSNSSVYTENWITVKSIENNLILLDNKKIEINDDVMLYNLIVLSIDEFIDKYSIFMED